MVWITLAFALSLFATLYGAPTDIQAVESSSVEHRIEKRSLEHQTMFLSESCPRDSQLDGNQKAFITDYHNGARYQKGSSNMNKLFWDDELACQAQRVADSCVWGHNDLRNVPGGKMIIGQNIIAGNFNSSITYMGPSELEYYMDFFYNEIVHYNYPDSGCLGSGECNHYRMMMIYKQTKIGAACNFCELWENNSGMHDFTNSPTRVSFCVFNFEFPLSGISGEKLYEEGSECSECSFDWSRCEDGLCVKCNEGETDCINTDGCQDLSTAGTCNYVKSKGWCGYYFTHCLKTCDKC
ncbi:peptidase inhibitor 16-like [Liolophura sinensis]|uniref:peptidase inhibitor 16-like n=1 Tax=Liolophura sinensis TaxID=3198878 RepID=UPI003157F2D8